MPVQIVRGCQYSKIADNFYLNLRLKSYQGAPLPLRRPRRWSMASRGVRPTPRATKLQGLYPETLTAIDDLGDPDRPKKRLVQMWIIKVQVFKVAGTEFKFL